MSLPIKPGKSLTGFSVSFDWLGGALFGKQTFEFFDSATYAPQGTGTTRILKTVTVPLPGTFYLSLLNLGLIALKKD